MNSEQPIVLSVECSGLATVTLNRPAKRNAVSLAMWRRLGELFSELGRREDVRVVVVTGAVVICRGDFHMSSAIRG